MLANVTKMIGQKKQRGDALSKRSATYGEKCLNESLCNLILCEGGGEGQSSKTISKCEKIVKHFGVQNGVATEF